MEIFLVNLEFRHAIACYSIKKMLEAGTAFSSIYLRQSLINIHSPTSNLVLATADGFFFLQIGANRSLNSLYT
jgi:hypothetical protein